MLSVEIKHFKEKVIKQLPAGCDPESEKIQ